MNYCVFLNVDNTLNAVDTLIFKILMYVCFAILKCINKLFLMGKKFLAQINLSYLITDSLYCDHLCNLSSYFLIDNEIINI